MRHVKKNNLIWGLFRGVVVGYDHQMAQYKKSNTHDTTQKRINNGFHNTKKHLMIGMKKEYIMMDPVHDGQRRSLCVRRDG